MNENALYTQKIFFQVFAKYKFPWSRSVTKRGIVWVCAGRRAGETLGWPGPAVDQGELETLEKVAAAIGNLAGSDFALFNLLLLLLRSHTWFALVYGFANI